jgi:hypothetical protein
MHLSLTLAKSHAGSAGTCRDQRRLRLNLRVESKRKTPSVPWCAPPENCPALNRLKT